MKRTLSVFTLLSLLVPLETQAQETPLVRPGDRVRVTAPECELWKEKGTLISLENGLLNATLDDVDIECPFEALTRLEGTFGKRNWLPSALIGSGLLAIGGAVMAPACEENEGVCFPILIGGGAALGFGLGAIVGLAVGGERWEEVSLPSLRPYFNASTLGRVDLGFAIPLRR